MGITNKKIPVLLCLASFPDRGGDRGRSHAILTGPPGLGKSKTVMWIRDNLESGYAGEKTTPAGLAGDMMYQTPKPGKLAKNHNGVLIMDEIDKMESMCRKAMYESMSDARITMTGAGIDTFFPANTIIIATANNANLLGEILGSRFDFVIKFTGYNRETANRIISAKTKSFLKENPTQEQSETPIAKYLKAVRNYNPDHLNFKQGEKVINTWFDIYNMNLIEPRRHIERVLRIGASHARLHFRSPQTIDFIRAIEILNNHQTIPELYDELGVKRL